MHTYPREKAHACASGTVHSHVLDFVFRWSKVEYAINLEWSIRLLYLGGFIFNFYMFNKEKTRRGMNTRIRRERGATREQAFNEQAF